MGNTIEDESIRGLEFFENTFIYIQGTFDQLDIANDFSLGILVQKNFDILFAHSFDGENFSEFLPQEGYPVQTENGLYVCIYCKKIIKGDLLIPRSIYGNKNVDVSETRILIQTISYQNTIIEDENLLFKTMYEIINEMPKWNFYDNQEINVQRWLKQCNSIAEMYGLTFIYFKTETTEVNHTLSTSVNKKVVNIKKLHINIPGNVLPEDRDNYTDWDFQLQDDFVIHIVKEKFEQAFGVNTIPSEKDYLYFPILNKLFRINTQPQPKKGFMGKIGWWEAYLAKFEDDETVGMDADLKASMSGIDEFGEALDLFEDELSVVLDEIDTYKTDTIFSAEKISERTIEEKKLPTQNFTNKIDDSNFYISLKETEAQREFYNKRLNIVSINPDSASFPVTMYNCTEIPKRQIGMQYDLKDYTTKNKFSTVMNKGFSLTFNFILIGNFVGEVFDIISENTISIMTLRNNRNVFEIIDIRNQKTLAVDFKFNQKEIYQVSILFTQIQYAIKIFSLINQEKTLEYQNIYIIEVANLAPVNITNLQLFGGNFYVNDIVLDINDKNILKDFCNPILQMNKFG